MRVLLMATLTLALTAEVIHAGSLSGPVLDDGVTAELIEIVQLPASNGSPPLARIAMIREVPDGSGRLFANDLRGPLHVIQGSSSSLYLDLSVLRPKLRTNSLAWGFASFAFHPDFSNNGLFYTVHTESLGSIVPNLLPALPAPTEAHSVLTEWSAVDPTSNTFTGSSRELMRVAAPHRFHNLGEIGFDPGLQPGDPGYGWLFVAAGDFGSVIRSDPGQLQRLDTVFGCVLRIDPLGGPFVRNSITYPYGIPPTNPYGNDGDPDTFGEIFAHGFRNPQNFHFDRGGDGTLYAMDIGESNLEEVNLVVPGANYGWPYREGTMALDPNGNTSVVFPIPAAADTLGYMYPAAQYDHEEGLAIAGGIAVRTTGTSPLNGKFVFGDIVTGRIFYSDITEMLSLDPGSPAATAPVYQLSLTVSGVPTTLLDEVRTTLASPGLGRTDLRFSADLAGRIFVTTKQDGFVRELVPSTSTSAAAAPPVQSVVRVIPNPFNPRTEIRFSNPREGHVRVEIFDTRGRAVSVLLDEVRGPGLQSCAWDGNDRSGRPVVSGVYLYRIETAGEASTGKMSLVR